MSFALGRMLSFYAVKTGKMTEVESLKLCMKHKSVLSLSGMSLKRFHFSCATFLFSLLVGLLFFFGKDA